MARFARRKSLALTIVLSTVTSVAFVATPAHADNEPPQAPPAGTPDLVDSQDPDGHQDKLTDLKTWIIEQPGLADSGYVESVNDVASLSTTLLWHGSTDDVQKAIIAEGRKRGITVTVEQRKFGRKQIEQAIETIAKRGDQQFKNFTLSSVTGITADFDGIKIEGLPNGLPNNAVATLSGKVTALSGETTKLSGKVAASGTDEQVFADVAKDAADQLGIDIVAKPGSPGGNFAATRVTDSPAFNAGGLMYSPSLGEICSTGFSVKVGGTPYTTTARHCVAHDYKVLRNNYKYGDGVRNSTDGAARQMSAKGSPLMFDGAHDNSSGFKKTVVGYGDVSVGDKVCASGANSGVHCNIKITSLLHWWSDGYPYVSNPHFYTIVGEQVDHKTAACQGDSGGPVLQTTGIPGSNEVKAVGMIQGGPADNSKYRTSSPQWASGICTYQFWFSAMRTIVNTLPNASLVTG